MHAGLLKIKAATRKTLISWREVERLAGEKEAAEIFNKGLLFWDIKTGRFRAKVGTA